MNRCTCNSHTCISLKARLQAASLINNCHQNKNHQNNVCLNRQIKYSPNFPPYSSWRAHLLDFYIACSCLTTEDLKHLLFVFPHAVKCEMPIIRHGHTHSRGTPDVVTGDLSTGVYRDVGENVTVTCDEGYYLQGGVASALCQQDGAWTSLPVCLSECTQPQPPLTQYR